MGHWKWAAVVTHEGLRHYMLQNLIFTMKKAHKMLFKHGRKKVLSAFYKIISMDGKLDIGRRLVLRRPERGPLFHGTMVEFNKIIYEHASQETYTEIFHEIALKTVK